MTATFARGVMIGPSRVMVVVSYIYTSALLKQSTGGKTTAGKAWGKGVVFSKDESLRILCCRGDLSVVGS